MTMLCNYYIVIFYLPTHKVSMHNFLHLPIHNTMTDITYLRSHSSALVIHRHGCFVCMYFITLFTLISEVLVSPIENGSSCKHNDWLFITMSSYIHHFATVCICSMVYYCSYNLLWWWHASMIFAALLLKFKFMSYST